MKRFAGRISHILLALSIITFLFGCGPKQNGTDTSGNGANTGLRYVDNEVCLEVRTGRMWQTVKGGSFSSLQEAEKYTQSLELGGYADWRLPTRDELFSLHYIFFWEKNGDCAMNRTGEYWSVSEGEKATPGHWETYFLCNPEYKYVNSLRKKGYVRAVRP